ncbi:hypothetical protein DUNSADRAFT_1906 [Dunaliella salina]|uniref:Uncharacterized protein n=1 Tax=Dunaliella salina TaxID=3046 RepID=A0ABQ7GWJ8_DUNSA|nr:hypothetical protein DUNSADRAFT_1906 [Dunaliella salina]|eukprot:KAF5838961.1 hypothetical protein DUNSADRAFT_1906 [Dunaliella salina]
MLSHTSSPFRDPTTSSTCYANPTSLPRTTQSRKLFARPPTLQQIVPALRQQICGTNISACLNASSSLFAPGSRQRRHARLQLCWAVLPASISDAPAATSIVPGALLHALPAVGCNSEEVYLEVLSPWDPSSSCTFTAAWQGRLLRLVSDGEHLVATCIGTYPDPFDRSLEMFPGWSALLRAQAPKLETLPWQRLQLNSVQVVTHLQQFKEQVEAQPQAWCNGTGPSDPAPTGLAYQLLNAGELCALCAGHRGMVMVQLHVGWGGPGGAEPPQPIFNPYVATLAIQTAARKDTAVIMSPAPGGLGLTALITADKDPFRSWAKYLAGINAQAAVVADSPFYKLLIGRMLGYHEDNIRHHIKVSNGPTQPSPQVVAAVENELKAISRKKPSLPWNLSSRGRKKT